jgi:hypothetical protein
MGSILDTKGGILVVDGGVLAMNGGVRAGDGGVLRAVKGGVPIGPVMDVDVCVVDVMGGGDARVVDDMGVDVVSMCGVDDMGVDVVSMW